MVVSALSRASAIGAETTAKILPEACPLKEWTTAIRWTPSSPRASNWVGPPPLSANAFSVGEVSGRMCPIHCSGLGQRVRIRPARSMMVTAVSRDGAISTSVRLSQVRSISATITPPSVDAAKKEIANGSVGTPRFAATVSPSCGISVSTALRNQAVSPIPASAGRSGSDWQKAAPSMV
jgi:hypothetical protein